MEVDIELLLENLKRDKSQRTKDSLDLLNSLLEARFNAKEKDYSIATIGRESKKEGGVGTVSIRNKSGKHFRLLIDAWATKANTTMKKPYVSQSRSLNAPSDIELLRQLDDPALRVVFGQIIAQRNKLRSENNILKKNIEISIQMNPSKVINAVEVLPALVSKLLPSEIEALKDAINEDKIAQRGWTISNYGAVKDEYERSLFKNGFVPAIQKILKLSVVEEYIEHVC